MSGLTLRPFDRAKDYPATVSVYNSMHANAPIDVLEAQDHDARFGDDYLARKVAALNGEVIAEYIVSTAPLGKQQVKLEIYLHTDHATPARRQQLYSAAYAEATIFQPAGLIARVSEAWTNWLGVYASAGFTELERMWTSRLNPQRVAAPFAASFSKADAAGIRFGTVADLPDTEETQRALYKFITGDLLPTVPFTEPLNIWPFDVWQARVWHNKHRNPASAFIAWHGTDMVGYSELYLADKPTQMRTGLTAVKPAYRRKGIALCLKLLAADYAKGRGITEITTSNHSINRPMLSINETLGFVRDSAWITLKKVL